MAKQTQILFDQFYKHFITNKLKNYIAYFYTRNWQQLAVKGIFRILWDP